MLGRTVFLKVTGKIKPRRLSIISQEGRAKLAGCRYA